ncbi:DNA cytosine methyltransferase [Streptomyces sp. NPDC058066]|uniref:DNA cytosine methyltransferase n=1 Tax=Streptomyces sp. NPDC058066 TaxID=3346323 RepID=UPI0036E174C7
MYRNDNDALTVMDWFCADTETEILTARGWRRYDQVTVGDLVASLNTGDGVARWAPVQRMNVFDVADEKMLRVEGKALSALVTVGHRWPVQQRVNTPSGRRLDWQIRTSDQLTLDSSVVRSAPFENPDVRTHDDALVELVGWAWTEGSYRSNGGIHLSQSPSVNPGKCERIEQALTALYGQPMGRAGRRNGQPAWNVADYEGTRYWRLNVAAAAPILAAAPDHVLNPDWLLTLTATQLDLLIEASMLADGTTRVRNGARDSSLSQNRQDRAEGFQFAAILAGRATSIHRWEMQHKGAPYSMWRVSLLERVTAKPLRQAVAEWTTHTGIVWCPTVEHGTWLCRRNGLVHWTGNCGAGGSSQGAHSVPNVRVTRAANHWAKAIDSHEANFPEASHYRGDIRTAPVWEWPVTDIFWASPECTNWSVAKGKRRDFDNAMQGSLLDLLIEQTEEEPADLEEESRALMEEVPLYLRGVQERGGLVKAGVVENVTDVRAWDQWDRWIGELHKMGYRTRIIALNSMHANPRSVHAAPQSRDRLYVGYWHESLGRTPDWDKWLRPRAWCSGCDKHVQAMQVFKTPGRDMGRYRTQYVYRCPNTSCRNQIVEPEALPAAAAIDWSIPGQRIGDRAKPLADKTIARIQAGLKKFAQPVPMMVPAGGTWRDSAVSVGEPMATRTTRENDGLMVPPLLVPVEGRDGKEARSAHDPLRTMTTRNETGLAWLPFIAELRGGGSIARSVTDALATVTASGNHHGLVTPDIGAMVMRNNGSKGNGGEHCTSATEPMRTLTTTGHQSLVTWQDMLVPYYSNGPARSVREPIGALSTRDRYALVRGDVDINDVRFRMLEPHEIGRAMSFADDYIVLGSKRDKVRQYGNAVTPNAAEVILCALVEAVTGEDLERHAEPELVAAA